MGSFNTSMVGDDVVWALQMDGCSPNQHHCWLPQYLTADMRPLPENSASADLRAANFTPKTDSNPPHGPFDALSASQQARYGTCFTSPGPANNTLHCKQTLGGTWLAWRWYKFVDQPAIQRLSLSQQQRTFMQARVERMHKMVEPKSEWIKAGDLGIYILPSFVRSFVRSSVYLLLLFPPPILSLNIKKVTDLLSHSHTCMHSLIQGAG